LRPIHHTLSNQVIDKLNHRKRNADSRANDKKNKVLPGRLLTHLTPSNANHSPFQRGPAILQTPTLTTPPAMELQYPFNRYRVAFSAFLGSLAAGLDLALVGPSFLAGGITLHA